MNDDEPRNAFERAARSLECPWYVAMMRDAETTLDDLAKSVENDENEDDASDADDARRGDDWGGVVRMRRGLGSARHQFGWFQTEVGCKEDVGTSAG